MNNKAKKIDTKGSGQHPILQAVRAKMESIQDGVLSDMEELAARIDRLKSKSTPPNERDTEPELEVEIDETEIQNPETD